MSYPRHSTGHSKPGAPDLQNRPEPRAESRPAIAVDWLILLIGVYTAVSPWVIHFATTNPYLTANNLIVGLAVTVLAFGIPLAPERMHRLAWTMAPLGVWLILAPSVVTASHGVSLGIVWSNSLSGGITCLMGLIAANA